VASVRFSSVTVARPRRIYTAFRVLVATIFKNSLTKKEIIINKINFPTEGNILDTKENGFYTAANKKEVYTN
jgi:hypothetical protein